MWSLGEEDFKSKPVYVGCDFWIETTMDQWVMFSQQYIQLKLELYWTVKAIF